MNFAIATPSLEELAKKGQLSEEELAVLNEENSPNSLFKMFGKHKLVKIINEMRLKYQNEEDKGYIQKLILRLVGEDSNLNWSYREYILQETVTCRAAKNKVVIVATNVHFSKRDHSRKPELKLYCNLKNGYVALEDAIVHCCSYPEQPIKSVFETIEKLEYKKPNNISARNT